MKEIYLDIKKASDEQIKLNLNNRSGKLSLSFQVIILSFY